MKNTKINQEKWLQKINDTMMIGGKSNKTFSNYKSQLNKLFKYYDENTHIDKLNEDNLIEYFKINYTDEGIPKVSTLVDKDPYNLDERYELLMRE